MPFGTFYLPSGGNVWYSTLPMEQTSSPRFILELYQHGSDAPIYVSQFDAKAEVGFKDYSESKENAVVFESREALLPLASIEVEALLEQDGEEFSAFDGFRILPFEGQPRTQLVSRLELEEALSNFEEND